MNRIEVLKEKVKALYEADAPGRAEWAGWLYRNHIFVVAEYASVFAERYGAQKDLVIAAALLHDIADAVTSRFAPEHEAESLRMARELLSGSEFSDEEVRIIVDDAIALHSCHEGKVPKTLEGKVMATADAYAHLCTDFYDHGFQAMSNVKTPAEIALWALPKIERDFNDKIFFEEVREEVRPAYEKLKTRFEAY